LAMRTAREVIGIGILSSLACSTLVLSARADLSSPPITAQHPVVFETPYKLGHRALPRETKAEAESRTRWNMGGKTGPWHPHPRVIVDNVRVKGAVSPASALRLTRANGYWPIRRCYDPSLVEQPSLRGKVSIRVTVGASGKALRSSVVGKPTLADTQVTSCIRDGLRGISYPATGKGKAEITFDVTVNPGDAPMKPVPDPPVSGGPGTLSLPIVQALVARHGGEAIQRCYEQAQRRVPGLWGRMVLRLDVAPNGAIREIVETDSTFPDEATTQCAIDAIRGIGFPPPHGGDLRIIVPIRFGRPPS
ncbi:MAG TPA: AgmX/PglI C-terminal domain-containing protein, partial [Polyangiaceae bacterium]|nr:AgmX/PglI C-terminal domain-containing protein [Polyangiaceae bacterium]